MLLAQSLSLSSTLHAVDPTFLSRDLAAAREAQEGNARSTSYGRTGTSLLDFEKKQEYISLQHPVSEEPACPVALSNRWLVPSATTATITRWQGMSVHCDGLAG